ncbi:hypothetical protein P3S68_016068 [Capsicum galapagoense]
MNNLLLVLCYFFSKQLLLFFLQAAAAMPLCFAAIFPTSFSYFFSLFCCYAKMFGDIFLLRIRQRNLVALKIGRDPTPSELHLHVHTHNHDGKSFVGKRSRLLHERYEKLYGKKYNVNLKLTNWRHIMKLREEQRRKNYLVLDLKLPVTLEKNFVPAMLPHISTTFNFYTDNKYEGIYEAIDSGPYYSFSSNSY